MTLPHRYCPGCGCIHPEGQHVQSNPGVQRALKSDGILPREFLEAMREPLAPVEPGLAALTEAVALLRVEIRDLSVRMEGLMKDARQAQARREYARQAMARKRARDGKVA